MELQVRTDGVELPDSAGAPSSLSISWSLVGPCCRVNPGPPKWQAGSPDLPGLLGIFRSLQTFRERELQGSKPQGRQGPTGLPAEDFQLRREDVVQMGVVFRLLAAPLMSARGVIQLCGVL